MTGCRHDSNVLRGSTALSFHFAIEAFDLIMNVRKDGALCVARFGQRRWGSDPYSPFQETVSRGSRYVPNRDWQGKPLVGLPPAFGLGRNNTFTI